MESYMVEFLFPVVSGNKLTEFGQKMVEISSPVEAILRQIRWTDEDVVMDIGCGNGYKTVYSLLPLIEKYKTFLAIDLEESCIHYAKSNCTAPKLEYHEANIEDISTFRREWLGTISKIISINCFHYLTANLRVAFENVFLLMAPGGEAVLNFETSTPIEDLVVDLEDHRKWKNYINEPDLQAFLYCDLHTWLPKDFRKMSEEIGFEVLGCEQEEKIVAFPDDERFKVALCKICDSERISEEEREEFEEYVFKSYLRCHGRNSDGDTQLKFRKIVIYLKKPNLQ